MRPATTYRLPTSSHRFAHPPFILRPSLLPVPSTQSLGPSHQILVDRQITATDNNHTYPSLPLPSICTSSSELTMKPTFRSTHAVTRTLIAGSRGPSQHLGQTTSPFLSISRSTTIGFNTGILWTAIADHYFYGTASTTLCFLTEGSHTSLGLFSCGISCTSKEAFNHFITLPSFSFLVKRRYLEKSRLDSVVQRKKKPFHLSASSTSNSPILSWIWSITDCLADLLMTEMHSYFTIAHNPCSYA